MLLTLVTVFSLMTALAGVGICWVDATLRPGRLRTKVVLTPGRSPFALPWPMTSIEAAVFLGTASVVVIVVIATGLWAGHALFGRSPLILVMGGLAALLVKVTAPRAYRLIAPKNLEQRHAEFEQQEGHAS